MVISPRPAPALLLAGFAAMTTLMAACVMNPWGTDPAGSPDGSGASPPGVGGSADEVILKVQAGVTETLQVTLFSPQYSEILWVRFDCPGGQELSCNDSRPATLSMPMNRGDTIILGVDGNGGQEGEFSLEMEIVP